MAVNKGVAPLDPDTEVGQFRLESGDTSWVELDPVEPGFGDYEELSDATIETYLAKSDDSVSRALGHYYLRLSGEAAKKSRSVRDHDLTVDLRQAAKDLRMVAQDYFTIADAETVDIFEVVGPPGFDKQCCPEAAYCRRCR